MANFLFKLKIFSQCQSHNKNSNFFLQTQDNSNGIYRAQPVRIVGETQELQKTLLEQRKLMEEEERVRRDQEYEAERHAKKQRKEQEEAEREQAKLAAEQEEEKRRQMQAEDMKRKRQEKMKQDEENHRRMMQEQQMKQQPLRPAPKLVRRDSFKALNDAVKAGFIFEHLLYSFQATTFQKPNQLLFSTNYCAWAFVSSDEIRTPAILVRGQNSIDGTTPPASYLKSNLTFPIFYMLSAAYL